MAQARIYLDFNATAPLHPQARAAVLRALDLPGNASSIHGEGRAARAVVDGARGQVAALAGAKAKDVVFTSGGTEAANLALTPDVQTGGDRRSFDLLLTSAGEHPCVLKGHRFDPAQTAPVPLLADGRIDLLALETLLEHHADRRVMLALQAANNETGVIQPVAEAAALVHARGGLLVCDAVQAAGKIALPAEADMLILSAHKLGGPKGAGALVFSSDRLHISAPLVAGGGQERGYRGGTENVAAIAGFGAAAALARPETLALRDALEAGLRDIASDAVVFGQSAPRLPNTSAFAVPGMAAEMLLIALDLAGVAVSSGSACSSGKVKRSHVLDAMAIESGLAQGALRASLGWSSTRADVDRFLNVFAAVLATVRQRRSQKAA